ncbi:hypothetical protein D3C87_1902280 [compost metagenome]
MLGRLFIDVLDEGAPGARAAGFDRNEEILEVAVVARGPGGSVINPMYESDYVAIVNCQRCGDGFGRVQ